MAYMLPLRSSSRAMIIFLISVVPAPISKSLASRHSFCTGNSKQYP